MKKILVLTSSFPYRGGEYEGLFIFELCKRLSEKYKVTVLAPYLPGQKKTEEIFGIKIIRFQYAWPSSWQGICYREGMLANLKNNPFLWFLLPGFLISMVVAGVRIVRRLNIDLIHAHWIFPSGLAGALVAKFVKVPLAVTAHGSDIMLLENFFFRQFSKVAIKQAKIITAVSQRGADQIELVLKNKKLKIQVLPMGVDTTLFFPSMQITGSSPLQLLFVGRLYSNKGLKFLINSLPEILKYHPSVELKVVGLGSLAERLKQLVKNLNLESKVKFLGAIDNSKLPDFYRSSAVFILPSSSEGLPVSLLEAMSSGCPAVVTAVGGIPEVVEHGKTGLLIQPRSSQQISEAVNLILGDQELRKRISVSARELVEKKFNWHVIAEKFKQIYEEVIPY